MLRSLQEVEALLEESSAGYFEGRVCARSFSEGLRGILQAGRELIESDAVPEPRLLDFAESLVKATAAIHQDYRCMTDSFRGANRSISEALSLLGLVTQNAPRRTRLELQ